MQASGMTNYRRLRLKGATYFFSVALEDRQATTLVDRIDDLRSAYAATWMERPFTCDAFVVLPNHLHAIWTLPRGDSDFSTRWRLIKSRFTLRSGAARNRCRSKREKQEKGIWQRRFWEHCIRDEADFRTHLRYCWANPVRHGQVDHAADWPFSSLRRDIRLGQADPRWNGQIPMGDFGE